MKPPLLFLLVAFLGFIVTTTCSLNDADVDVAERKDYTGYKLIRTSPLENHYKSQALQFSLDAKDGIQLWTFPKANQPTDILASPNVYPQLQKLLQGLGIDHEILQNDISKVIEAERAATAQLIARQVGGHRMDWTSYHRYADIYGYMKYLAGQRKPSPSGAIVTMENIGPSYENRDIALLKISNGIGGNNKSIIWLDGGIHAREWISPATVTYIVKILVEDSDRSSKLLDKVDFYVVPVINVDGYEYSHTRDRYWRKTRSRTRSIFGCRGVDPNRNWAYKWGGAGSSNNKCSDTYRGPYPFSENETIAVSNAILARKDQIILHIAVHSYSQLLLIPWSHGNPKSDDYDDLYKVGLLGVNALESTYGTKYQLGTAPDLIYEAAGGSDDWVKGTAGVKYVYTFELRDKGKHGFNLPPDQIIESGEETFNSFSALVLGVLETRNAATG